MSGAAKMLAVVIVSELIAAWVIWRIAKSTDRLWMKIALAAIALVPIAGPLIALWIGNFPSKAAQSLQDRRAGRYSRGWYYLRWNRVLGESSSVRRFRLWRNEVARDVDADP